ncbi:MAG: hypothetical protein M1421_02075 [Candidatus Eremiobacteraeota bacterium]|nr:hypothetical protein [Candidatus Eremiobacteraeota bacterium]
MGRKHFSVKVIYAVFLVSNLIYAGIALYFSKNFHTGPLTSSQKETFLLLRMVFAGIAIFYFFPLVYCFSKRNSAADFPKWYLYFYFSLALSESVSILGLALLFITSGLAVKTFFIFLGLGVFYQLISWPKFPSHLIGSEEKS